MEALAHALNGLSKDSLVGKMVDKALKTTSTVRKRGPRKTVAQRFNQGINQTLWTGIGSLRPCSLLQFRPGSPVEFESKTGRVKWGLSNGVLSFVVISFDEAQKMHNSSDKVIVGIAPIQKVTPCACAGYLHKKHCSPKGKTY